VALNTVARATALKYNGYIFSVHCKTLEGTSVQRFSRFLISSSKAHAHQGCERANYASISILPFTSFTVVRLRIHDNAYTRMSLTLRFTTDSNRFRRGTQCENGITVIAVPSSRKWSAY
jgi:hypothetical protein